MGLSSEKANRDVERYIIAVVCGAAPSRFLLAVRSLMDFRYLAQSMVMDEEAVADVEKALKGFHANKQAVIDSGARNNKKGQVKKWAAPKFEFLHSVAWNIRLNGVALQWSADGTERAHIDVIKNPSDNTNNQNYESQIVRHLDRQEKCRLFDLATAMRDADIGFRPKTAAPEACTTAGDSDSDDEPTTTGLLAKINPVATLSSGSTRPVTDYFMKADFLKSTSHPGINTLKTLPRTFSTRETAFHLKAKPDYKKLSIEDTAVLFDIPDLKDSLVDYAARTAQSSSGLIEAIGGRRGSSPTAQLPFTHLAVWTKVRIQNRAYHFPHPTLASQTINASPKDTGPETQSAKERWPHGRFDPVIANFDPRLSWPQSGLRGVLSCNCLDLLYIVTSFLLQVIKLLTCV